MVSNDRDRQTDRQTEIETEEEELRCQLILSGVISVGGGGGVVMEVGLESFLGQ